MAQWDYNYFADEDEDEEHGVEKEHRRRVLDQVEMRYRLRDVMNPFTVSVKLFRSRYRLPQHLAVEMVDLLAPYMGVRTHPNAIPVHLRVLCALGFYAKGSYQEPVGDSAYACVSQASVSNCIAEVTHALNHEDLLTRFIRFPLNQAEREETIAKNERLGLPRVLGFVDGTLVKIFPPSRQENGQAYRCRKGFAALNVQVVCDADLMILDINARFPGSCNDSGIFQRSGLRDEMERAYRQHRCWLLGDSGYREEPWLHTPLPHARPGTPEFSYTRLHCRCRNVVERCIGVMKGRWRCLIGDRALHYAPVKAGKLVNACAVLHNYCQLRNVPEPARLPPRERNNADRERDGEGELNWGLVRLAEHERRFLIDYAHDLYMRGQVEQFPLLISALFSRYK